MIFPLQFFKWKIIEKELFEIVLGRILVEILCGSFLKQSRYFCEFVLMYFYVNFLGRFWNLIIFLLKIGTLKETSRRFLSDRSYLFFFFSKQDYYAFYAFSFVSICLKLFEEVNKTKQNTCLGIALRKMLKLPKQKQSKYIYYSKGF